MRNAINFAAIFLLMAGNALADDVAVAVDFAADEAVVSAYELRDGEARWTINDYVAAPRSAPERLVISSAGPRVIDDAARSL